MSAFRILGPIEVWWDGERLPLGGPRQVTLLAVLLLHANRAVARDELFEVLWGSEAAGGSGKRLQVAIARLRKTLAPVERSRGDPVLHTVGGGYSLSVAAGELDADLFASQVQEGRRLITAGDPERGVQVLRAAEVLWRGPALSDVAYEAFAQAEVRRLDELRLSAIEARLDAELELGRHAALIGELEALAASEPTRELVAGQLALALYRSGRQADALEALRRTRVRMRDDLGLDPGAALRLLQDQILRQDPALVPVKRTPLPDELDAALATQLHGRERELAELRAAWSKVRAGAAMVVTVSGLRGSGTTRLAAELAAEVHAGGAPVVYDDTGGSASRPSDARPALLVLDNLPLVGAPREPCLLTLICGPAAHDTDDVDAAIRLGALDARAVGAIAAGYAPAHVREIPADELLAMSGGLPGPVHECARRWAQREAGRHVEAVAGRTAVGRAELRSMELELTGGVAELQATHDRAAPSAARRRSLVCPYKGLAAFDAADSEYYCGRERLVAELVARLVGTSLLGLVGPSGSGKSSLLRAGLLAALADGILPGSERWQLTLIRPGEHPRATLAYVNLDGRVVLAVDQFEETFTTCPDEPERVAFIAELVRLAGAPDARCTVVLVLRADHYGRCADYPELARLLVGSHVLVPPMRPDELRRAIELPAERAGLEVEEGLAERLAGDVAGEPGALPLLSTALLDLWQRRDGRRLSVAAYEQIGGVRAAVARLAEDAYERLEPGERDVARRILLRLVVEREAGVFERRRMPLPEVGEELSVINRLSDERLLTITDGTVEVAHEALFREWPRLRAWLEEDAESRRVHRDLADASRVWESDGRASDDLYRGARLASALEWRSRHEHEVESAEHEFLTASEAAASRGRRRLQAGVVGLALLLVLAGAAGLVALHQRGNALDVARTAQAQRLGAQGLAEQALDRALLLAAEGVALEDSAVTRSQLLRVLLRSPEATWIMRGGRPMTAVDTSPDGRVVAVGDEAGNTTLVDSRTRRRSAPITVGRGPVSDLRFSPDGTRLAVATAGLVVLLDSRSRRPVADWNVDGQVSVRALAFSADSRTLAASVSHEYEYDNSNKSVPQQDMRIPLPIIDPTATEEEVIRWDARTGRQLDPFPRVLGRLGPVFIDFSSTNHRLIAVDARTSETTIRDARTLATVRRFDAAGSPAAVSPDRRILGLGAADGSVRFLDLDTGMVRRGKGGHGGRIQHMRFSADSRRLATAGRNGEVIIWDTEQAASVETLSGHAAAVTAVSLSPDSRSAYSVGLDGALIASDLTARRGVGREFHTGGGLEFTGILAAAADGGVFAVIDGELNIQAYDSRTLKLIRRVRATPSLSPLDLAISPDGRTIAVSVARRGLVLIDTRTGRMTALPETRPLSRFAFSPDGRWFAVADEERRTLELWDRRGPMRRPLTSARLEIEVALTAAPAFDPGGRWLAVTHGLGRLRLELWSLPRLEPVRRTLVPVGSAVTFDPAGQTFAYGDAVGRTWRYDTSTLAATGAPLAGHDGAIASMSYSGSGRLLATASIRGPARLWDLTSDPPTATALTDGDAIPKAVAFIRDGSHLLSISGDGHGRVWDLRPSEWFRRACAIAGRSLTRAEWQESLPDRPYAPVCRR